MEITRADIDRVAQIMGKDFSDLERTDVIQCMDCCDVNACPGSGKTTAMVAKLLIMSEKLAGTMTGICALSHTNAAKDEIKKSFGPHSEILMRYPHFVGTIQVFVDSFLAIPAYIEAFGHRPIAIDDDLYENAAKRYYSSIQRQTQNALDYRTNNKGQELFCNTSYGFDNFGLVNFDGNRETEFYCRPATQTYRDVLRAKHALTSLGYITYHDAFSFANRYIQKYPKLTTLVSNRFSYVFIDEMQDTDYYQNLLIETIFRGRSIIQKFGDPNQAIYGQKSQGGLSIWQPQDNHSIRTSRRLSPSISHITQGICSQPREIRGNDQIPDHPHTIILFDQGSRQDVIPRFGYLIEELQLQIGPFKALGAVGRLNIDPNHLSISSYWPSFQRRLQQNQANNPFWGLVRQAQSSIKLTNKYLNAHQLLTKAFTDLLQIQQVRTQDGRLYNSVHLLKTIRESSTANFNQYQGFLLKDCERLFTIGDLDIDNTLLQARSIFSFLGVQLGERAENIIRNRDEDTQPNQPVIASEVNIYSYLPHIPIEINTVHASKGQTHQATLVLETYFHQNDLSTIMPYLAGGNLQRPGTRVLSRYLPLTYVACTRPSHFLCLAIQRDHIDENQLNQLRGFGWRIDELTGNN